MRPGHSNAKITSPLLQLPPLPAAWQPLQPPVFLARGTGNSHWLLHTASGPLVWRQFGTAPGSNHPREVRLLSSLQHHPWAPRLLPLKSSQGLLMQQASGQHPLARHLSSLQRQQLLQLVTQLWQHPCEHETPLDYPALLQHYWQQAGARPELQPLLESLIQTTTNWPVSTFRLTHHDLHGGNLLLHENDWTLLDWEYAAPGNPWIDAVSLDRFLHLTSTEKQQLQAYLPSLPHHNPWETLGQWLEGLDQLWQQAAC